MTWQTALFSALAEDAHPEPPALSLRPYQAEARAAVAQVHQRARGALVVLPTGSGKTRLCGAVAWDHAVRRSRVLVTCPTIVLCRQMYEALRALGLRCAIEQASNHVEWPLPQVTVASVATMRGDRLKRFPRDAFGLVVADEAHRSVSKAQLAIFEHFDSSKRLGLTATPDRVDGVSLANVFEELAYEMTMLKAIEDGWLVPLRFKTAITDFDPKSLRSIAGEVDPGSVAAEITRSGLLHEAANTLAELADGERTVAFLPTVASSKAFVGELAARGVSAEHVDGTTPELTREATFKRFRSGEARVLCNVGVCTEGWDAPEASVVALLNPTKSRSRITQMIGRGTRLAPGKESCLVIDFCPGRLKRGRLASPADALAGKMLTDAVHNELASEGDLAQAIEDAEITVEEIERKKRVAEEAAQRKADQAKRLAKHAKKRSFSYGVQDHDAKSILGGDGGGSRVSWGDIDPSDAEKRRSSGLCSPKQAKLLAKFGLDPDMKWRLARKAIDAIAENGWKVPEEVKNDKRYYPPEKPPINQEEMSALADDLLAKLRAPRG